MLKFKIFDVGHGFCALAATENGNSVLFDCGHKSVPEHRPSSFLHAHGVHRINKLVVTNYDEDHISDLPRLRNSFDIDILSCNRSITPPQLKALKEKGGPISPAMTSLLKMMATYTSPVGSTGTSSQLGLNHYFNTYGADFTDTNNISIVTIMNIGGLTVCIPGDVETPAWDALLTKPGFASDLATVDVFVASHHGRESGYNENVLGIAKPDVVVFSDGPKQYATQEMTDIYARHASGVTFRGRNRKVLTTRSDGPISWNW